ncbi:M4 family metallopeptidase [uncultured Ruminococcus sp.]|uniref:M4 family metallopeptidase n=1 Tax=uncultured Ruminococcus sp. TaxID=165186 RepID=UPI0026273985|nr:M4 family metallopeptidase [uncultured Ruminococcus sp.]
MEKLSKYFIEKSKNGEEQILLKNAKGIKIASGVFSAANPISRRRLKNIAAVAADAEIEVQVKKGYEKKTGTKFEIFQEKDEKINFRLRESNGNIILSGNSYESLADCINAVKEAKDSIREMSYSNELTALHQKPVFVKKKASPRFATLAEERTQAELRSRGMGFSVMLNEKERPFFITGRISDEKINSPSKAIKALNYIHHTMGFENAEQEFDEDDTEVREMPDGMTFYRMKQYHKGIPVDGHTLIISADTDGNPQTLSGQYAQITCDDDVKITEDQAKAIAGKKYGNIISSNGLTYYVDDNEKAYLCWCIITEGNKLFISTTDGNIVKAEKTHITIDINTNRRITTSLGEDGAISILNTDGDAPLKLSDGERNIEVCTDVYIGKKNWRDIYEPQPFKADSNTEEALSNLARQHPVTAYYNMKRVYDYYLNVLGRKGADDRGKKICLVMNYHEYWNEVNACFRSDISEHTQLCFGPNGDIERCVDVVGHEFTHAVVDATCKLKYENQSGAINEAYADILGEFAQDGTLDSHGENKSSGGKRYFNNGTTMSDYHYLGENETLEDHDQGYVHENSAIISHAAFLIWDKWPGKSDKNNDGYNDNKRCELSALFYRSLQFMSELSDFRSCGYALINAAFSVCSAENINEKLGAIADAFLDTGIIFQSKAGLDVILKKAIYATGKVTDSWGNPLPGVAVSARYGENYGNLYCSTVTNSKGEYKLILKKRTKFKINFIRLDGYYGTFETGSISNRNHGEWNTTLDYYSPVLTKSTFIIHGRVKHPETGNPIVGATIKIVKGTNIESEVMTKKPAVVLKTDANGYFFTAALPKGDYDVWAYSEIKDSPNCLSKIVHINNDYDHWLNMMLERKARFYVTGLHIRARSSLFTAIQTKRGYTRINTDMNCGNSGDWIFMSYCVDNYNNPITNLLIYESNKQETWKTKELTHNGITATYKRLNVNLNRNSNGKYIYLCATRDKQFSPLTRLDVLVKELGHIRAPYWSGVRVVKNGVTSVDDYANTNESSKQNGYHVHIMQARKETM